MDLYVKMPISLLDEDPAAVWHYSKLYIMLLRRQKINLTKYAKDNKIKYNTARRFLRLAKQQRSK
tara:strand:+ start:1006 stop:1200 length:195 start_codon:yes stop_codon:yes gene_type:complete